MGLSESERADLAAFLSAL